MVFTLRQLQEKCIEQHQDLYIMFVDLTKAFDTVSRPALWAILSRLGCPPKFVRMIRAFHEGMMARVIENGDVSDPFPVSNGVKQGCVLAPTLFSLIFSVMLSSALSGSDDGILICFRTDGKFYDLRRLQARTKVKEALIRDFLFADDCAIAAPSEAALQRLAVRLSSATKAFGLTIRIKKTEVLCQPAPKTTTSASHITIDGSKLNSVDHFCYLGSHLSADGSLDKEITCRISKASRSFGRLQSRVWRARGISPKTKIAVYRAIVLPSLLYGCETWTCYRRYLRQLDQFHLRCLRKILGISWEERLTNQDVLRRANLTGIEAMIIAAQLRWSGHVMRMHDNRIPKQIFCSELVAGKRRPGGQIKRYKDNLKRSLRLCSISPSNWTVIADDRSSWRTAVHVGVKMFEQNRLTDLDRKRAIREARESDPSKNVNCPVCGRACASAFGLSVHRRKKSTDRPLR